MRAEQFNFVKNIKKVNLRAILRNVLKEHERDILDLQKEQMSAGLADMGDEIQPAYRDRTIQLKKAKGQENDHVTLRDTGSFYRKQYAKFSVDHFEITSSDRKRLKLLRKYSGNRGGDIFGLAPESKAVLADMIKPEIQNEFKDKVLKAIS